MADPKFGALKDGQTITLTVRRTPPAPEARALRGGCRSGDERVQRARAHSRHDRSVARHPDLVPHRQVRHLLRPRERSGSVGCTEPATDEMLLEPAPRYVLLKDLVVDLDKRIKGDGAVAGAESEVVAE